MVFIQADKESDGYDDEHAHMNTFSSKDGVEILIRRTQLLVMIEKQVLGTIIIITTWWQNSMRLRIKAASIMWHCMSEHWKHWVISVGVNGQMFSPRWFVIYI